MVSWLSGSPPAGGQVKTPAYAASRHLAANFTLLPGCIVSYLLGYLLMSLQRRYCARLLVDWLSERFDARFDPADDAGDAFIATDGATRIGVRVGPLWGEDLPGTARVRIPPNAGAKTAERSRCIPRPAPPARRSLGTALKRRRAYPAPFLIPNSCRIASQRRTARHDSKLFVILVTNP